MKLFLFCIQVSFTRSWKKGLKVLSLSSSCSSSVAKFPSQEWGESLEVLSLFISLIYGPYRNEAVAQQAKFNALNFEHQLEAYKSGKLSSGWEEATFKVSFRIPSANNAFKFCIKFQLINFAQVVTEIVDSTHLVHFSFNGKEIRANVTEYKFHRAVRIYLVFGSWNRPWMI